LLSLIRTALPPDDVAFIQLTLGRSLALLDPLDLHVRDGNQAGIHHFLDDGGQSVNIFGRIHDGDDNGQIVCKYVGTVDLGRPSVAFQAPKHRRSRDLQLKALLHDSFI